MCEKIMNFDIIFAASDIAQWKMGWGQTGWGWGWRRKDLIYDTWQGRFCLHDGLHFGPCQGHFLQCGVTKNAFVCESFFMHTIVKGDSACVYNEWRLIIMKRRKNKVWYGLDDNFIFNFFYINWLQLIKALRLKLPRHRSEPRCGLGVGRQARLLSALCRGTSGTSWQNLCYTHC